MQSLTHGCNRRLNLENQPSNPKKQTWRECPSAWFVSGRGCWAGSAVLAVLHLSCLLWEQHLLILLHTVPTNASPAATEILTGSVAPQLVSKVDFVTVSKAAPAAGGLTASVPAVCSGQFAGTMGCGWTVPAKSLATCPSTGCPGRCATRKWVGWGGFLMQDMTCAVQVCLSFTVPFTGEELFVSCQCCLPWGVFFSSPFAIFTACFPCFPSCICKAASNKALADNLILKHKESCSFH